MRLPVLLLASAAASYTPAKFWPAMDTVKYDRQIRLFGMATQQKISEQTVQVLGGPSYIACEIIKNVALLGVRKLIAEEAALAKTRNLVPDGLCAINEKLEVAVCDRMAECDFLFLVGHKNMSHDASRGDAEGAAGSASTSPLPSSPPPFYFICSECYLIQKNKTTHTCTKASIDALEARSGLISDGVASLALDCIAGAFAVQEFIKCITDGGEGVDSYRLRF